MAINPNTHEERQPADGRAPARGWRRGAALLLAAAGLALSGHGVQAQVGMAQLQAGDLPVTLVYPTAEVAQPVTLGPFTLSVARDAAPTPGLHRLVVMSHGTGGSPLSDHALAATLARAGFVVAQPLHQGDNHADTRRAGPESWALRPQEVSRVIDALGADARWQPLLQLDKVGVHGMSAGGSTALALAGAQWRLLDMARHCLAHGDEDAGFCFTGASTPQAQAERRAAYGRVQGVAESYLPAAVTAPHGGRTPDASSDEVRPDARVASVTLAVPLAAIFSGESLARIRVPVGVVTAGRDTWLLPAFHGRRVLAECSRCTLLADLPAAAHMDLLSPWPAALAQQLAERQPTGGQVSAEVDSAARDAAFQRIADFHRQHLQP